MLIRVARWLGVPPWELARQPIAWQRWALAAMTAEAHADEQRAKQAQAAGASVSP